MTLDEGVADLALNFLCQMHKARDKRKVNYREWVTRVLTNIVMYLDAIKPRLFSASPGEMNKPLPIHDICFDFIFDKEASEDRRDLNTLTIKEMNSQI